jgi:isoleucyl-tRNA synthetase
MSDADAYKDTVFLPKTDFPMRGELPKREPEILKKWQDMDLYVRQRELSRGRKKWILHWGPPYANGHAHMGHAFTKSLKDVVNRSHQMLGNDSPLIPGWDCHGLPIEWKVEEKYRAEGKNKDDVDVIDFRAECRAFAQGWVDIQAAEFQRLGVNGDWKNPYLTMNFSAEAQIVREIHKFLLNGSLYKGLKPVMWSVVEKTALAEAEVEYKEHKSITVWVKFPVVKTDNAALKDASVVIWTTTPWTLPSNRAIAFGEKFEYAVYTVTEVAEGSRAKAGDRLILAVSLAESVKDAAKIATWEKGEALTGSDFVGTICAHPLRGKGFDYDVPMLAGGFVTEDTGTGFVHIAPSHGVDDYNLFITHFGVRAVPDNVTDDGKFRDHVPLFAGMSIYTEKGEMGDGNFAVLKALDEAGELLAKGSLRHDYPHSWRSKAPLIFRTTPQWFIALDDENDLRKKALKAIGNTRWVPPQGENRIRAMIEQRPDWCISRQRTWGVPIALFLEKKTGEPLEDEAVLNRIAESFEKEGADAWWSHDAQFFLGGKYKADDYEQIFDIVDVWFESGCTHAFVLEARKLPWPADLYLEGSDQHRGWFHSSLLEACGTRGKAPYKAVLTHGFVLDEKGYKMSKSLGNIVDPNEMIGLHGADIVRLWALLSDYNEDIRIGKDTIKLTGDLYRRIRNTFRYLLGALDGFSAGERLQPGEYKDMPELELLVLHWLKEMDGKVRGNIEDFNFSKLIQELHNFCTNELSAFYFDIRKDRLYCDRPDLFERRATRTVMAHVFECLTAWLAPYLCFTAEEAWEHRPRDVFEDVDSVHLRVFPDLPGSWKNDVLAQKWKKLMDVRRVVLGALEPKRAEKTIGSSLEAAPIIHVADDAIKAAMAGVDLAELCITSQASVKDGFGPEGSFSLPDIPGVAVEFAMAEGKKCQRCWKTLPEVGRDHDYPDLSLRDADAVRWYMRNKKAA